MAQRFRNHDDWEMPSSSRRGSRRAFWWLAIAVVMYGVGAVTAGPWASSWLDGHTNGATVSSGEANAVSKIYQHVSPSIFTITGVSQGTSRTGPQEDVGTGFLIDRHGDIATNNHVVSGMQTVTVTVGDHMVTGKVVGQDVLDDLAVVRIPPPAGIQPLPLGSVRGLIPGTPVVAIGNPFQLSLSVTSGIISGLNRSMPSSSGWEMTGLLQTDAPLNPGNSGGPLLNSQGQVVGINTAIESPVQGSVGIGFAIPIDKFESVLPELLTGRPIPHPWIGIIGVDIDPGLKQEYHLPVAQGILVLQVAKGGPAQLAGVHPDSGGSVNPNGDGDIIVAADGQNLPTLASLTSLISTLHAGTVVHLSILRGGHHVTVNVTLQNSNR